MANQAPETVRKSIRASLTPELRKGLMHDRFILLRRKADLNESQQLILAVWTTNLPQLGLAHDLKEDFFDLWKASTREEAMRLYQQWQARIPADLQPAFQPLLTAMENWNREYFNYFDHPITTTSTAPRNALLRQPLRPV